MSILREQIPYFLDVFSMDGFLKDPVLVFGFQECFFGKGSTYSEIKRKARLLMERRMRREKGRVTSRLVRNIPATFQQANLQDILKNFGVSDVWTLDFFDQRATIVHDMNLPIDNSHRGSFSTIIDIGCLEHVFDTKQCLWNLFRLLKVNGHLLLHTPCNGFFDHGFHTFSPECIIRTVAMNGFEVKYIKYSTIDGFELERPNTVSDALIWLVGKKREDKECFVIPQQKCWKDVYKSS
jgi:SAM-dependent methyltransferase